MKNDRLKPTLLTGLIMVVACTLGAADERELIAVLQSDAGAVQKCAACQQLRIGGTAESIVALAALLGDERVGHAARYALEGMPYAEASAALREALGRTSGVIKAGLIDSAGRRRDTAAVPLLVPLLSAADTSIAAAAAAALGGIGDEAATAALRAACDSRNPETRNTVFEALLRCAERRLGQGDTSEAAAIYRHVLEAKPITALRIAAWRGLVLSDGERRTTLVLGALTGGDESLRLMAIKLVRDTKDDEMVRAGLRQWESLGADVQALLVDTVADRGDRSALAHILEACASSEESVRIAGLKAVGVLGDAANVALLAERVARTAGDEQVAARASLTMLRGRNVHAEMIGRLTGADAAIRVELIQALAARRAADAIPALLQMAAGGEASVRMASYGALRELAGAGEVEALVALLADAADDERKPLENTILGVARRGNAAAATSKAVMARLDSAGDARLRGAMIGILGQLGDASALATLRGALGDPDVEIRYAAIAGLSHWPDAAPLPDLLRIAGESDSGGCRIRALRAYVELVGTLASMAPDEKVRCHAAAMSLAPDAAVKRMVFAALATLRTPESMQLAASHVQDEQAREEAALAAVTVAQDIYAANAGPAKEAMTRVAAADVRQDIKDQANAILGEIEAVRSYLTDWEVAGPYLEKGKNHAQLFDIAFDPEKPEAQVQWRKMPVSTNGPHPAYLDLLKELDGGEQRVAYVRTQIKSPDIKPVTLEIFSDDGVKAWLNGQVVHANNVARPIMPEPDRVTVTLQKGVNRLMLKVTQNNLPWGAVVRVREAKPVEPKLGEGFKLHTLNADSRFEAAGVLDVNRDGKLDILCGGFWYEAPAWRQRFVREIKEEGGYYYDFANLPMDVDGDGWTDTAGAAWHNKMVYWVRNPGPAGGAWQVFEIDTPGNMETAMAFDIDGDGQLDILPNIMTQAAWYEFHRDASAPQGVRWEKHELPKEAAGHGLGAGDVNGDGRCDIVTPRGWLEQTADGWQWHSEFELGHASIPILVHDVDGDGDADIIWGLGHDYGLFWLEHSAVGGKRSWQKHLIDDSWSQPHYLLMADLDTDGTDELVTGKRYHAHNGNDPGGNDPVCVYSYDFDPATRTWTRHTLHEGGRVAFGINTAAVDIDGDGDIDVVAPGKSGLYLFENLLK